mmetsp:Transcript_43141/g.88871  ORF Transcript_43141/g.88871 Transcript_43141/m.88871 type:complete len:307 (+) Transcript_43141:76-996(+)
MRMWTCRGLGIFLAFTFCPVPSAERDVSFVQLETVLSSRDPGSEGALPSVAGNEGPAARPWEVYHYLAVAYHKSGVDLMKNLLYDIFHALGAPDTAIGKWCRPCYPDTCANPTAPIRVLLDMYSPEVEARERASAPQGMRAAGSVRNPLDMVASAYCYHIRMQEPLNLMTLAPLLLFMDVKGGVAFLAQRMLEVVEEMTAVFESPANDTHRVDYERMVGSSDGFDVELEKLLTFWFEGLNLTDGEWELARRAGRQQDLHRFPEVDDHDHTNSPDCMANARNATLAMPAALLARYRACQQRLGYPMG